MQSQRRLWPIGFAHVSIAGLDPREQSAFRLPADTSCPETYSAPASNLSHEQERTTWLIQAPRKNRRADLVSVTVAAVIAVVGTAILLFMDFAPNNEVQPAGISMIAASVAERAGAIALPTDATTQPDAPRH